MKCKDSGDPGSAPHLLRLLDHESETVLFPVPSPDDSKGTRSREWKMYAIDARSRRSYKGFCVRCTGFVAEYIESREKCARAVSVYILFEIFLNAWYVVFAF